MMSGIHSPVEARRNDKLNRDLFSCIELSDYYNAKHLLESGANPNYIFRNISILGKAVDFKSLEFVKLLIDHGADPNFYEAQPTCFSQYNSPFSLACSKGYESIIISMLESDGPIKVNLLACDQRGITPAMHVAFMSDTSIISINLINKIQTYFEESILSKQEKDKKLSKGHLWLSTDDLGKNAFMYMPSIEKKQWIIDQNFMDAKKLIDLPDKKGRTNLWTAVENGEILLVKYFLKLGAKIDITDSGGETLICMAKKRIPDPFLSFGKEIFSELIQSKAIRASQKSMEAIDEMMSTMSKIQVVRP